MSREGLSVAVVIPARDPAPWLARAIASAIGQLEPLDELIVIDDGLTAATRESLFAQFGEGIRVTASTGRGAAAARNTGVRAAKASWVAFLDSDDTWLPGHVATVRRAIAHDPAAGVCFGGAWHVDDSGRLLVRFVPSPRHANLAGLLHRRLQPTTSATAVRRTAFLDVGGFHEGFSSPSGVEDIDLWWRLADRFTCLVQPRPLVRYVVHQERDRSRSFSELQRLYHDRVVSIDRLRGAVSQPLLRVAAAEHHAVLARYWYLAGFRSQGLRASVASIAWRPTLDGIAALGLGMLPEPLQRGARVGRHWLYRRVPSRA